MDFAFTGFWFSLLPALVGLAVYVAYLGVAASKRFPCDLSLDWNSIVHGFTFELLFRV